MADIKIKEMRFSIIWVDVILDLLASDNPTDKLSFLRRASSYMPKFRALNNFSGQQVRDGGLTVPWDHPKKHHYWERYLQLGRNPLDTVRPAEAWHALIPFRKTIAVDVPALQDGRAYIEMYLYPHGVTFVLNVVIKGDFTLVQAANTAIQARRTGSYDVSWDSNTKETLRMTDLHPALTQRVLEQELGVGKMDYTSREPMTVFTVFRAEGVDLDAGVDEGSPIHRFLDGVTSWSPTWQRNNRIPKLAESTLGLRPSPDSHILYARKRARAIWFPYPFTEGSGADFIFTLLPSESLFLRSSKRRA